jgi:hypothetical protein
MEKEIEWYFKINEKGEGKTTKVPSGEVLGFAFIYWNEIQKRYELKLENRLKAFAIGVTAETQELGKQQMITYAKDNGYSVYET